MLEGSLALTVILAPTLVVSACARPAEPAGYGYQSSDDPLAESRAEEAELPTSCEHVRCLPPRVCRVVSLEDPAGIAHAWCLGPDDDVCQSDPALCR